MSENFFTSMRTAARNIFVGQDEPPGAPPVAAVPDPRPGAAWGLNPEYLTDGYDANEIFGGERARELEYRGSFFYARTHDHKRYDMNGAPLTVGTARPFPGSQPMLASAGLPNFVPIAERRPNAPYRLPRTIVKAFTGMLFGQNRWPQVRSDDPATQAFCEAIEKAAKVRNRFVRGRNMGGAHGTCGFSWLFRAGKPIVRVHSGRFCQVLEWEDPDEGIPAHVTELYKSIATRRGDRGPERFEVWCRRDWTKEADVVFKPVEATGQNPTEWVIDEERSFEHGHGRCHFVWVTNFADDEDPSAVDGLPDYAELYEQMDTLDMSNSICVRGVNLNLDPTLHVKRMNPEDVKTIRKGSENAIVTEPTGDAKYLTLDGSVVDTGEKLVTMQRRQILEVSQCVVADPNEVAAAGTSSLTMKLVYAPMIGATDLLREPYGDALVRLYEQMQDYARGQMVPRKHTPPPVAPAPDLPGDDASYSEDGASDEPEQFEAEDLAPQDQEAVEVEEQFFLDLPPRVVTEEELGPDGNPTGKILKRQVEQQPGDGKIELEWGEYFPPTADDKQKTMTTLAGAAGGKPVVSQRTAVEVTAGLLNKDATQEWERVSDEAKRSEFSTDGAGGEVDDEEPPPGGDTPRTTPAPPPGEGDDEDQAAE